MILVTGASGFLGLHLLEVLSHKGESVRALYFSQQKLRPFSNVEWVSCNLLDVFALEDVMTGVSSVYHCAATVSFNPKDKNKVVRDNIAITANLVNAALTEKVERFVHVSSIAALSRNETLIQNKKIDENDFFDENGSHSKYALGKYYSEMEIWRGIAEGLKATIINPAIILGAGDWTKGSAHLMTVCNNEFPWFTNGVTGWVDVNDVVKAMILLMASNISGKRYILSAGNYSFKEIFTKMANALDKKTPRKHAGKWISEFVWRWSYLKSKIKGSEATITKETAKTANQKCYYDNSKFLKSFPDFKYTAINETIHNMANAFQKQKNNRL